MPLVVSQIDLLEEGLRPVDIRKFARRIETLLDRMEELMLSSDREERQAAANLTSYQDPALEDPSVARAMAARLWRSGMLREVSEVHEPMDLGKASMASQVRRSMNSKWSSRPSDSGSAGSREQP